MNEEEKRVKILEVFHETVRFGLSIAWVVLAFAERSRVPVFPPFCGYIDTDARTERLLHGAFGAQRAAQWTSLCVTS
jgi:hypothetical protein